MAATSPVVNARRLLLLRLQRLPTVRSGSPPAQTLMGYELLLFVCVSCNAQDTANVELVPSLRVKRDTDGQVYASPDGQREPLCRNCSTTVNEIRADAGMEPIIVHPDAYEPQEVAY